jgi:hypothetical protein
VRLTTRERSSVAQVMAAHYRKASQKEKGGMLDELIALTGYNRWYAVGLSVINSYLWDKHVISCGILQTRPTRSA